MLHRNTNQILIAFIVDFLCLFAAIYLSAWLRVSLPYGQDLPEVISIDLLTMEVVLLYPLIFTIFSLYAADRPLRSFDEYRLVLVASLVTGLCLAGLVYFTSREISRLYLLYFYTVHFLLVIGWRIAFNRVRSSPNYKGQLVRKVLLIGGGEAARMALQRLDQLSWAGIHLVGYLTDKEPIPSANGHIPYLGTLQQAVRVLKEVDVDDVLIALPAESYNNIQAMVTSLIDKSVCIWVVPDYFSLLLYGSHVEDLGGIPMISLKAPVLTGSQRVIKRAFDLIIGTLTFIVTLPLMLVIAVLIKLDSTGPVFFKQRRVGENGRLFDMWKFRSMVVDADKRIREVMFRDEDGNLIHKRPDDPRVTRIGQFIRRTSLDELPQLFNVLTGEMSLVGPRPEMPLLVAGYEPWQRQRFAVPQGITGWWQVNGRSDKPMHLHTEDDIYYVQNYSLLLDIQILIKTFSTVVKRKGAF